MRWIHATLTALLFAVLLAEGATRPANNSSMKAMYESNLQMKSQIKAIERELARVKHEIGVTEKAIRNLKYVRVENAKFIRTLKP